MNEIFVCFNCGGKARRVVVGDAIHCRCKCIFKGWKFNPKAWEALSVLTDNAELGRMVQKVGKGGFVERLDEDWWACVVSAPREWKKAHGDTPAEALRNAGIK